MSSDCPLGIAFECFASFWWTFGVGVGVDIVAAIAVFGIAAAAAPAAVVSAAAAAVVAGAAAALFCAASIFSRLQC